MANYLGKKIPTTHRLAAIHSLRTDDRQTDNI